MLTTSWRVIRSNLPSLLKFSLLYRERIEDLKEKMAKLDGPCLYQVDAHNVIPVWETSDKQEYAARTIRNKIMGKLSEFLTDFPPVVKHPHDTTYPCKVRQFLTLFSLKSSIVFI